MTITDVFTTSLTNPRTADLYMVKGDDGRIIGVRVYAGSQPWTVPEGAEAEVGYILPEGGSGSYGRLAGEDGSEEPACSFEGNMIYARLAPYICRQAGVVQAVITLRRGERRLSTFPFRIHVMSRPGEADDPAHWPEPIPAFAERLYWGSGDGSPVPLDIGDGLEVAEGRLRMSPAVREQYEAWVQEQLELLQADLKYRPIEIVDFRIEPELVQMGTVVENPVVSWVPSKTPEGLWLDGQELNAELRAWTLEGIFEPGRQVLLEVIDEKDAQDQARVEIRFCNAVYYGKQIGRDMPTDAQLQAMEYVLQSSMGLTIAADADFGEYVLYAIPSRYGTPKFWCGGLQAAFEKIGTMEHTNQAGYQERYDVWISEADGLSGVEIIVA